MALWAGAATGSALQMEGRGYMSAGVTCEGLAGLGVRAHGLLLLWEATAGQKSQEAIIYLSQNRCHAPVCSIKCMQPPQRCV